ncbi:hypothetical protein AvCA_06720 [Azotobacter vinelandii CA]|uniref:Uncharacterized protein n=2 Tax=Azotobacter vinelandii TaxID=354 RepID=C1DLH5_AZOVD|nr:hypothetical protein Avin_06720 [Azotobacter vinelandii DJ]AGK17224.1 hypothetical protein AvCA_06720 [Azotobacter vinelandii CA]AGK19443.1 hypothetical protein AvCA6_06720 [Azotobacter vinelandii CA6]
MERSPVSEKTGHADRKGSRAQTARGGTSRSLSSGL